MVPVVVNERMLLMMLVTYGHFLVATGMAEAGIVWTAVIVVVLMVFSVIVCELMTLT